MAEVNSRDSVDWPRGPKDILAGLILPLPFLVYGIACVATRTGWIPDGVPGLSGVTFHVRLDGGSAVALGIAVIAVGILIHTHCLWRNWFGFWRTAALVEAAMLLTFTIAMFVVVVRYVSSGRA